MVLPIPLYQLQCGMHQCQCPDPAHVELTCNIGANSYDWGKKGHDSAAARFAAATEQSGFKIESDKPYAEV